MLVAARARRVAVKVKGRGWGCRLEREVDMGGGTVEGMEVEPLHRDMGGE